jgi:formylglycine-generating enzyme required for sulfatase activity
VLHLVLALAAPLDLRSATIDHAPEHAVAAQVLIDEIASRAKLRLKPGPANGPAIILRQGSGPADGYSIRTDATTIRVTGNDRRGVLYGVGRLLRELRMEPDRVELPAPINTVAAPRMRIRGHQMGNRPLNNTVDAWTVAQWEQHIRDLAVFGTNAVELIPPQAFNDTTPLFKLPPLEMMAEVSRLLDRYGFDVWIWFPVPERDYRDSATVDALVADWATVFAKLPRIDAVFVPGGDPGHTEPKLLMPLLSKQAASLRRHHPNAKIWVSPQGFDSAWLGDLFAAIDANPPWLGGIVHGPGTRLSVAELRARLPRSLPIRTYPDITHALRSQYPVPNIDPALALTHGREPIQPRPRFYADVFQRLAPGTDGFITYSDGTNDDVNKVVFSALGWDPRQPVESILRDYGRYFVAHRHAHAFADGLLSLEDNWKGPLLANTGVDATLAKFRAMESADLAGNWRFLMGTFRAHYDAYVRNRLLHETALEAKAMDHLRAAPRVGPAAAMAEAESALRSPPQFPGLRARVWEIGEALRRTIGIQLATEWNGYGRGRATSLDTIDTPLNDRAWLEKRFAEIRKLGDDKARLAEIHTLANWTNPGPGGFYDDLGHPGRQPHFVWDGAAEAPWVNTQNEGPLSWSSYANSSRRAPIRMRYTGLDPSAQYRVRVVYGGDRISQEQGIRCVADGKHLVHPYMPKPLPVRPVEFDVPMEATADGAVELAWDREPAPPGRSRGAQICEVWLIRAERPRNSLGMEFSRIAPGSFDMGESVSPIPHSLTSMLTYVGAAHHVRNGDFDEKPVHRVSITKPFLMATHEVTNAQYEQFDPGHRKLRGNRGDHEAATMVSWHDAVAFAQWLSKREGRNYRLPTEAEWEYACRAGTRGLYSTGDTLPPPFQKNVRNSAFDEPADIVDTTVGRTPPNAWGLYDMHGNVEEWVADWYGPYAPGAQADPVGRADGDFRVVRGGSHGTLLFYLRSANRMGFPPEVRSGITGFRLVQADPVATPPLPAIRPAAAPPPGPAPRPPDPSKPHFRGPRPFVRIPPDSHGPLFSHHNHDTAIAEMPNGDLLAIWYTCVQERGRELAVASSRLRPGAAEWEPARPFFDAPDRNDHAPSLWFDGASTVYHFNGLGIAGRWAPVAIAMRTSTDSGYTWSKPRLINPLFDFRGMLAESTFRAQDGSIVVAADISKSYGQTDRQRSTVWISRDEGGTWHNPEGVIPGVHAAVVQLKDGRLMALGRGENVDGRMPMSFSSDMGRTWTTQASAFPGITGGQRAVLHRLKDGGILFCGFAKDVRTLAPVTNRYETNIFAAVSYDEGRTWPHRRIVGSGPDRAVFTLDQGRIRMNDHLSEPVGYLSVTEDRNQVIHLISSINHYEFNAAWVRQGQPEGSGEPKPVDLPVRAELGGGDIDPLRGFTVEATGAQFEVDVIAVHGPRFVNKYSIKSSGGGVWRIAVRPDTVAQVYRDGRLVETKPPEIVSSLSGALRGSRVESKGARVKVDGSGAFAPK